MITFSTSLIKSQGASRRIRKRSETLAHFYSIAHSSLVLSAFFARQRLTKNEERSASPCEFATFHSPCRNIYRKSCSVGVGPNRSGSINVLLLFFKGRPSDFLIKPRCEKEATVGDNLGIVVNHSLLCSAASTTLLVSCRTCLLKINRPSQP